MTVLAQTYYPPFALAKDDTEYRNLSEDHVEVVPFGDSEILRVDPEALTLLSRQALRDASFLLRTRHLEQVAAILDDKQASDNDRNVALALLRNAEEAAHGVLPLCQDTGTATVYAKKGHQVWTGGNDEEFISRGILDTYQKENLRYSQSLPLAMYEEKNSGNNLPGQIDLVATDGMEYDFLFVAKGGGSANKMYLFQETKALLRPDRLEPWMVGKMKTLGTAACPPYHVAFVIGGTSAEANLKAVKLATTGYLDTLPTEGGETGQAFRDTELEQKMLKAAYATGIGAQFGGKYFALDVRVIRMPRHGASCPIGMGVSCSAHRNVKGKIDRHGVWIEQMETNPGRFIPDELRRLDERGVVKIDLHRPMAEVLAELSKHPVLTRVAMTGTIVVARDIAHARIKERLDQGQPMPEYMKNHPVYYAGPAKTPEGMPSGSFGPTTAGRMDGYVEEFQSRGGSMVMIAKGNRGPEVREACNKYGGFYLGSIGGPAAILAKDHIESVEVLEYPELGMEAVYKIEVKDFPAFILIDDKGNDFFAEL
jgi:fumarate hydratase, class I